MHCKKNVKKDRMRTTSTLQRRRKTDLQNLFRTGGKQQKFFTAETLQIQATQGFMRNNCAADFLQNSSRYSNVETFQKRRKKTFTAEILQTEYN